MENEKYKRTDFCVALVLFFRLRFYFVFSFFSQFFFSAFFVKCVATITHMHIRDHVCINQAFGVCVCVHMVQVGVMCV